MADNFKGIKTPHAAVMVWNYVDRIGTEGMTDSYNSSGVTPGKLLETEPLIISTLSCISIQTSKSKSQPDGQFQLTLAPFRNWTSTLTTGSWCVIMMSNEPIQPEDFKKANKNQVKMFGRIESVRVETQQTEVGRETRYYVTGSDWGHIFNSTLYVDNLLAGPNDPVSQGNAAAVALRNALFGKGGTPKSFNVDDNLKSIVQIFGQTLQGFNGINRLAKAIYDFKIPKAVQEFFDFRDANGKPLSPKSDNVTKLLGLKSGVLIGPDKYTPSNEAKGFINPFSLQGSNTLWQILLENSNPALNEMYPEMRWSTPDKADNGLSLTFYNRIKPFAFKSFTGAAGSQSGIKSYFQWIRTHQIDNLTVRSVNAGTNWRDKYNFIEIKPEFQEFNIFANWYKQKAQMFDENSFNREGFRPLIVGTKQFPSTELSKPGADEKLDIDWSQLTVWVRAMREWYFNTHRMLNGTIVMQGTTEYIAVGNNIKFDAGLINPTPNINASTVEAGKNQSILAHVETVTHNFAINGDARTYTTTIQFVRGIIVDGENVIAGRGTLDKLATSVPTKSDQNTRNTVSTSSDADPDKHVKGK